MLIWKSLTVKERVVRIFLLAACVMLVGIGIDEYREYMKIQHMVDNWASVCAQGGCTAHAAGSYF
jgi:hypothetical protein